MVRGGVESEQEDLEYSPSFRSFQLKKQRRVS